MSYQVEQKRTFAFLRLPFEAKRRRVRPWLALGRRLTKPLLVVLLVSTFTVWLRTSQRFAVAEITVVAESRVHRDEVEQRLAPWLGRNVFALDLSEVRKELQSDPWIGEMSLHKQLPSRLRVRLRERRPVALWEMAPGELFYLDSLGAVIAPVEEGVLVEQWLTLRSAALQDSEDGRRRRLAALDLARQLKASDSLSRSHELAAVEILSTGDLRLELRSADFSILVAEHGALPALVRFERLWGPLEARGVSPRAVDLRFTGRVLVEPAPMAGKQES